MNQLATQFNFTTTDGAIFLSSCVTIFGFSVAFFAFIYNKDAVIKVQENEKEKIKKKRKPIHN